MTFKNNLLKNSVLFAFGGYIYLLIELAWRGKTHPSMFFVGGLCFWLIGLINEVFPKDTPLFAQMGIASVLVSAVELVTGCVLNLWLGLHVWDYRNMPLNLFGQACIPYMALWFLLSYFAIRFDDWLRWRLFGEEKPEYRVFKHRR